jgi:hypothetical protein
MTAPENFVSRWARLKSEADTEPKTEIADHGSRLAASVVPETPATEQQDAVVDEPFDPASLPSIETITVDTDIRGFLQSHVPAGLTRAALRQAWASDPAIRDFIGIAENQWDFNDPTAIPGCGPMLETDNMPALLARALGGEDRLAGMVPDIPALKESVLPVVAEREPANPDQSSRQPCEKQPVADEICGAPDRCEGGSATQSDQITEKDETPRKRHSHGSALPR